MKKLTMMKEKRQILVFFKKYLYTFLISVVIGLSPNISFSQENLNGQLMR